MILGHDYPDTRVSREVKTLSSKGYKITIVSWIRYPQYKDKDHEVENGLEIIRVKSRFTKEASIFRRLLEFRKGTLQIIEAAKNANPDIIHCNDLEMMYVGIKLKKLLRKPLIFDMRENWPEMMWVGSKRKNLPLRFQTFAAKILEKGTCKKADKIIVVVKESKDRLIKKGIDANKITVVMNTEIPENFSANNIDKTLENELKKRFTSCFVIGYTGGFGRARGLKTAIRAMPYVLKDIPKAKLLLVGSGDTFDELNKLTDELGLKNDVIFTGKVPHEMLPTYVNINDVCLIPHLSNPHTNSTIPNKLFQYMLMGKPQIVTDLEPLKRIINETKCGIVVPSGDHQALADGIIELGKNAKIREKMGKNGKESALRKYNWNTDKKKLVELYKMFG